jgi:chromosome segregation ATPase
MAFEQAEQIIADLASALEVTVNQVDRLLQAKANDANALNQANMQISDLQKSISDADSSLAGRLNPVFEALKGLNERVLAANPESPVEPPIEEPTPIEPVA